MKNDYYAKSSAVAGVYKVSSALGEELDKGLEDFATRSSSISDTTSPASWRCTTEQKRIS